jgi:hypothetical protein
MRIFIFKSDASDGLRAFAGDGIGSKLPGQFAPWHVVGVVAAERNPPHKLPRDEIERAIGAQGFQLWRLKRKGKADGKGKVDGSVIGGGRPKAPRPAATGE